MPRRCTVCWHEARPEIEALIRGKVPYTEIAERFGLSRKAVGRHAKNHMDKRAMVEDTAGEIQRLRASGTVEERLDALLRKAEDILYRAERGASVDTQIRALAECRHQVELMAKLIGQIKDETTVQILQVTVPND